MRTAPPFWQGKAQCAILRERRPRRTARLSAPWNDQQSDDLKVRQHRPQPHVGAYRGSRPTKLPRLGIPMGCRAIVPTEADARRGTTSGSVVPLVPQGVPARAAARAGFAHSERNSQQILRRPDRAGAAGISHRQRRTRPTQVSILSNAGSQTGWMDGALPPRPGSGRYLVYRRYVPHSGIRGAVPRRDGVPHVRKESAPGPSIATMADLPPREDTGAKPHSLTVIDGGDLHISLDPLRASNADLWSWGRRSLTGPSPSRGQSPIRPLREPPEQPVAHRAGDRGSTAIRPIATGARR